MKSMPTYIPNAPTMVRVGVGILATTALITVLAMRCPILDMVGSADTAILPTNVSATPMELGATATSKMRSWPSVMLHRMDRRLSASTQCIGSTMRVGYLLPTAGVDPALWI